MKKKGMIGMMETFMIIFVIFILIGFGMYFFYKFSVSSTITEAQETCELSSYEKLLATLDLPGLQCSFKASPKDCVDTAKLRAFIDTKAAENVGTQACTMKIVFKQIYPQPGIRVNDTECTPDKMRSPEFPESCGKWTLKVPKEELTKNKAARVSSTPVSLYYPHIKQYGIGQLEITTYTYT
ncbi:MAG: hypothetical protein KKA65_02145 [Nanoarchaeota archaeon]|nr:hypothetical protein [Nanoarchaeota archaeon]MBU4352518.1 hypothetical protein [Nanoarchaeota archaeon]MBU4456277.1 hypothetical protein [Nanoarchaeota archaeon]MCG2720262.1 hypothetical protein [Nanoarchaeota archaeon]